MKKLILLGLLCVIAVLAMAACAQTPAAPAPAQPTAAAAQPTTAAAQPTAASGTTKQFRVAVIMPSARNDLSFSQSMYDALGKMQSDLGKDKFDFVYSENMFNVPDAAAAIRDYASKGYDLIIAHGSQFGASLADIAPDFPNTSFAWGTAVDTYESKGIKNIFAYTVASDQGGYVEGVLGAALSKTGKLGYVGPMPVGDGQLTGNGFVAGVKATNPKADVKQVFVNSFSDVALASQAAQTYVANGVDVMAGTSQNMVGAVSVAKDKNALWFGNDVDQSSLAPANVVASQVYDWTYALKGMMQDIASGKRGADIFTLTLKNGGLKMVYNPGFQMPADVKSLGDKAIAGIVDGSIVTSPK